MCWCGFGRRLWRFSGRGEGKRTAFPNALLIPDAVGAADPGLLHPDSQVFTDETDGLNDGEVGVPPKLSLPKGVEPVTMETNIPVLIPAPQAPQKPQAPPGTDLPRLFISTNAFLRSMTPPEFL